MNNIKLDVYSKITIHIPLSLSQYTSHQRQELKVLSIQLRKSLSLKLTATAKIMTMCLRTNKLKYK